MTKLEHFTDSARAMARSEWKTEKSLELFDRAKMAIEETNRLIDSISRDDTCQEEDKA